MTSCIFCKIVNGDLPCYNVYEDSEFLAFLDIFPKNKGHALVIPKKHYELTIDMPDKLLSSLIILTNKIARIVNKVTNADGYILSNNNGKHADQEVPHVHFHIIPRFESDNLKYTWPSKKFTEKEFKNISDEIKKFIE